MTRQPSLDTNGFYPFSLLKEGKAMRLALDGSRSVSPYFISHLRHLQLAGAAPEVRGKQLFWKLEAEGVLTLTLRGQPVSQLLYKDGALAEGPEHAVCRLIAAETRTLGLEVAIPEVPYDRAARRGFEPAIHAPLTDIHTHASAQIPAEDLFAIGLAADVAYPAELLEKLGVGPAPHQKIIEIPSFEFTPLREEGLACERGHGAVCKGIRLTDFTDAQRAALTATMHVAGDTTLLLSDFERVLYRYRNPLVKNPALTKAFLMRIAEDYAAQGIAYAELSTGSMMNPDWFKAMAGVVSELDRNGVGKKKTPITLRFLIGLPRNISPQETLIALKKIQYLAQHPYIVGVDLLGYEINKTSDFQWALAHLAQWALHSEGGWDFRRDFVLRIHAGETGKNSENVNDAIAIARDYGVRVRVAHALRATMDKATIAGLKSLRDGEDRFAFEMCPDSNQVYMNNMLVHTSPLKERFRHAPMFLGTDGGGALATTPRQLALSALAAGLTLKDLAAMRKEEEGFIARQRAREKEKRAVFHRHYTGLDAFLAGYKKEIAKIPRDKSTLLQYLPESFTGKTPLLVAGASGTSWNAMNDAERRTIREVVQLLVRVCDPAKVYFVLGRVQKEGVSRALDIAVREHNKRYPDARFDMLARYAGAEQYPTGELAESISWVQNIAGGRDAVPVSMLDFLQKQKGLAVFCGGTAFTAEMAKGAAIFRQIPHALMVPSAGILAETAAVLPPKYHFRSLDECIALLEGAAFRHCLRAALDMVKAKKEAIVAAKTARSEAP